MQSTENSPVELQEASVKSQLQTNIFGKKLIFKQQTTSTQTLAHEYAKTGYPHGTVVIAKNQTKARGRSNRSWHSLENKSLSMSIILRPDLEPNYAPQLTLFSATVIADVIKKMTNIRPQIKWPNDLLINGQKLAGILTEMHAKQRKIDYIIVGIGMNINFLKKDLPKETNYPTTSLRIETKKFWDLNKLACQLLKHYEEAYRLYEIKGFEPFHQRWEKYAFKLGEKLLINDFKKKWFGKLHGISEDGALIVKDKYNRYKKIYSAEIEWYN